LPPVSRRRENNWQMVVHLAWELWVLKVLLQRFQSLSSFVRILFFLEP
jgi:hypothetical protein